MAVTLENIKFYSPRPHSLPARPLKHTPNNPHTLFPHPSKNSDSIPSVQSRPLLSSLSQIATPHFLPPRPPRAAPSNRDSASARSYSPPNTASPVVYNATYPNDFDRMLDDVSTVQGEKTVNGESSTGPPQTGAAPQNIDYSL